MNTQSLLVGLTALSLGATCYLVASLPKGDDDRIAELERKLEAAEKRADAIEALRGDVRAMRERVDRRVADIAERVSAAEGVSSVGSIVSKGDRSAAAASLGDERSARPFEDLVAERVEKKVTEKIEALAARDKERGDDGKWKAPIDELSKEISMTETQKAEAKRIFEASRDETYALLKTQRLDGGSLLDDFAAALKSGADPTESTKSLFTRIFSEKVPGSDRTYLAEFIAIEQGVQDQLGRHLDAAQVKRLKSLRVDLLDVNTGYDPVGDYIKAKLQ
jgi:hypothetical protein